MKTVTMLNLELDQNHSGTEMWFHNLPCPRPVTFNRLQHIDPKNALYLLDYF